MSDHHNHQVDKYPQRVKSGKNNKLDVNSICWICFNLGAKLKCSDPHCDQLFHKQCLSQQETYKLQSKVEWRCPDCQFKEVCDKAGHNHMNSQNIRNMLKSILKPESPVYQFISDKGSIQELVPFGKFDSLMELILDLKTDIVSFFKKNGSDSNKRKIAKGIFVKFQKELTHPQSIDDRHIEAFLQGVQKFALKVKMLRNENVRYRKDLGGVKKILELTKVTKSLLKMKYEDLEKGIEREKREMNDSKMQLEYSLDAMATEKKELKVQLNAALHKINALKANFNKFQSQKNAWENEKRCILSKTNTAFEECNKLRNETKGIAGNLEKITTENISLKAELDQWRQREVEFHNKNNRLLIELDLCQQNTKRVLDDNKILQYDLKATKENNLILEIELAKHNNGHQLNEQDDIQSLPTESEQWQVEEEKKSVLEGLREKIQKLNAECDLLRQERDEYREKWKNSVQTQAVIIEID